MTTTDFPNGVSVDGVTITAAAAESAIANADATAAVTATLPGAAYVEAEAVAVYNDVVALRAQVHSLTTKLNSALAALRVHGVIES